MYQPGWLTGPIFDKELRVSSRRRRNYALRFFYILLLTAFIGIVWLAVVPISGNAVYAQSNMAVAGRQIVMTIVAVSVRHDAASGDHHAEHRHQR